MERICRAPRYAVRGAGKASAGAVPLLVASLPQRFEATRQPCFLYVASELIKTFGDEPARELELGEADSQRCCGTPAPLACVAAAPILPCPASRLLFTQLPSRLDGEPAGLAGGRIVSAMHQAASFLHP